MNTDEPMDAIEQADVLTPPPQVLKVAEGLRTPASTDRTFSVVTSRPVDDLAIVAAAVDPRSGLGIPPAGQEHPQNRSLVARPPMIYPVGLRAAGGAMLACRSSFYNVRVPYVKREGE